MSQGLNLAAQGQLAQAEVTLEQARAAAPRNIEILTALAKVKDRVGELPAAIAIFREVTAATPRSTEAHLNLAMALADSTDLNGALDEVSKAVELSPKLASAHLNRARILADLHRLDDARAEFVIASRLAPTNPDCFFYWALVEKENVNYAKESELLRTVVRLQPRNEKALNLLGQSLFDESKETEAIATWRRLLAINPNSSEANYSLSQALRTTDPQESKRLMDRFHAVQQREKQLREVNTLGNQAYAAINNRQWPEAIAALRQAATLCGDCQMQAGIHKDLGLALCNSGDIHAGEAELRIALRLNPADPGTLKALKAISRQ
jgi:tetratricopeptide (TPR) repeat protein